VGEQLPDRDTRVGQGDRAQAVVRGLVEAGGIAGDDLKQFVHLDHVQESAAEVLPRFAVIGGRPPGLAGVAEPGYQPPHVRQHPALRGHLLTDEPAQRRPAWQAVFPGDGQLGLVQGGELARPHELLRLDLQVPQVRVIR
jgi:hypothetical protein